MKMAFITVNGIIPGSIRGTMTLCLCPHRPSLRKGGYKLLADIKSQTSNLCLDSRPNQSKSGPSLYIYIISKSPPNETRRRHEFHNFCLLKPGSLELPYHNISTKASPQVGETSQKGPQAPLPSCSGRKQMQPCRLPHRRGPSRW